MTDVNSSPVSMVYVSAALWVFTTMWRVNVAGIWDAVQISVFLNRLKSVTGFVMAKNIEEGVCKVMFPQL